MHSYLLDADSGPSDWGLKVNTCEVSRGGGVDRLVFEHARIEWAQCREHPGENDALIRRASTSSTEKETFKNKTEKRGKGGTAFAKAQRLLSGND